ncbi:MAG: TonB-dependent receptor [Saprospiraceae bacterium]|nr:TonB-dependent receptor [Saprospiraceae bacterium]
MRQAIVLTALLLGSLSAFAQVTTSSISGLIADANGEALIGATVVATHVPSGTRYGTSTNASGRYVLPAVRVGGPFNISVSYTGYEQQSREGIYTNLGVASNINFVMQETSTTIGEVSIVAQRNDIFSSDRTGAAQTFDNRQVTSIPTIGSRSINSITKYNPQGNGSSFGAQDSRLNNFTIDGSVFNNGFGLGSDAQAGGRTGSTAISLDAIEELQVNVAPFDVRQSGFVGSGINAVTRSGNNETSGSAYYNWRNNSNTFNGSEAAGLPVQIGNFDEYIMGGRLGGAIVKNKLFYFISGEIQRRVEPATTFVPAGSTLPGTTTRVEKTDLEELRRFLKQRYNYETGEYEGYNNETTSDKFLVRLDWNVNDKNKLTLRYTHHNSLADQLVSNSSSLGLGPRRTSVDAMSYQNSGYFIGDNTRSIVSEWNSTINDKMHNTFIVGYDYQNEDRQYKGALFPTIDIQEGGKTYISAGFDPFTPANLLDYGTFHVTNNLSIYKNRHTFTVGANYEYYKSNNSFFSGSNGVYVFNSLQDFYDAANFDGDTSPVDLRLFQYRYSALEGGADPLQILKAHKVDVYGQDEFQVTNNFRLLFGLRMSAIFFENTALTNTALVDSTFIGLDEQRNYKINTGEMPETKILFEPRLGFNWDVNGNRSTQIRGGTGIFTGRPPYVWVSNQIGNNGVLTGFIEGSNTTEYKFTTDPSIFRPDNPQAPSAYDIAYTDPSYKFPQIWKTNLAVDQKIPFGFIATAEFLFNQNVNSVRYFDANLEPANRTFAGPDSRPRFPGSGLSGGAQRNAIRVVNNVSRAAVMTTTDEGYYFGATVKLEYPVQRGLYGMFAYTYSQAKDLMSAGSVASGSFTAAKSVVGNNILDLQYADQDLPNRMVGLLGYRIEYGNNVIGATQFSIGYVGETRGFNPANGIPTSRYSWSIAGDMNGDGVQNNDLLFVPENASDLTFATLELKNSAGQVVKTFTPEQQRDAFEAFIKQDEYLSANRGQYAVRNGVLFPMLHRFDFSVVQEFGIKVAGKRNTLQFRVDILNAANMINDSWGVQKVLVTDRPISFSSVDANGVPRYTMATQTINGQAELLRDTYVTGQSPFDVWNAQFGIRYIFN